MVNNRTSTVVYGSHSELVDGYHRELVDGYHRNLYICAETCSEGSCSHQFSLSSIPHHLAALVGPAPFEGLLGHCNDRRLSQAIGHPWVSRPTQGAVLLHVASCEELTPPCPSPFGLKSSSCTGWS